MQGVLTMFSPTHKLIGNVIGQNIERHNVSNFSGHAFEYGCILPDLLRRYRKIPHYKEQSFPYIKNQISDLLEPKGTNRFMNSLKLGIITHYICDYFCWAHNLHENEDKITHAIYETRLMYRFKKLELDNICKQRMYTLNNTPKTDSQYSRIY